MNRSLIVARMAPGSADSVAAIFGRSDATALPQQIGVAERALFRFHDLYVHMIEFDPSIESVDDSMRAAAQLPAFRAISEELRPHITAYDPETWRSPRDAMATCFYRWTAPGRLPGAVPGAAPGAHDGRVTSVSAP